VLDARYCGYGASGRNGGIADSVWPKFPVMRTLYGQDEALRLAKAVQAGLGDLQSFCDAHQIDAEIRHQGHLRVATNHSQLGAWEKARAAAEDAGERPFRDVSVAEVQELSRSAALAGGIYEEDVASLQPGKLVRGLRRVAAELGARIVEHTAMTGFGGPGPVTVRTTAGEIRARKVVLAMNAWAASRPEVRPYLFVTSSDIVATPVIPGLSPEQGLGSGIGFSDARRLILYWRSTPEGRIVFGKGGGHMSRLNRVDRRFTGPSSLRGDVASRFHRLYPELRGIGVEQSWNGPIDYSSTGLPYFGPLQDQNPDVLIGVGYSGNGVVPSVLGGKILASLVLETADEYSSLPLTRRWRGRLPPEPFRSVGAPLVRAAMARKELMLDAEAAPGRLLELVASLDPTASPAQT
jgi:glycine/D-amino acid oxidase-like deaminating enzyme